MSKYPVIIDQIDLETLIEATEKLIDINDEPIGGRFRRVVETARAAIVAAEADKDVWTFAIADLNTHIAMQVYVRGASLEEATGNLYLGLWPDGEEPPTIEFAIKGRVQFAMGGKDIDLTAPKAPPTIEPIEDYTPILISTGPNGSQVNNRTRWSDFKHENAHLGDDLFDAIEQALNESGRYQSSPRSPLLWFVERLPPS